ncbi:cytochrome b561 domain-containing At4g18260-like [Olea europaea subsp. europaea]|uniref:Cytochrome b561 domain-containing At4g18260-like n=1 Tax=Olea europaea subsp. europaea TaxID=158383 RepID=A0A8S0QRU4_OLEEU|nr:cytochrome b561 domain-containing At4g18260-like [Olea europaea subsp. europaea]
MEKNQYKRQRIVFYIHVITEIIAVLLATVAAVLSLKYLDNSLNNLHQRVGLALYGGIWLQALIGILRPHRERKGRNIWNIFHWLLGIGVSFLGVINIYTGLQAYHEKTSKSARIWTIIFIAQICLTIFLYLLQEKRYYIQNQGVILVVQPTDQELSPRNKQKETPPQNCRGLG